MQSGFRAHGRVSLSPLPRQAGRKPLPSEKVFIRMDRRRSRALFCVSPFCREARLSFLHTTTIRHKASFSLSRPRCARSLIRFPGLHVPLSRPPFPSLVPPSTFIPLVARSRRPCSTDSFLPRGPYPSLFPLLLLSPC